MASQTTALESQSLFLNLEATGQGGPFALEAAYHSDPHPSKINLILGAYRDEKGQPWPLTSVTEAKRRIKIESCLHEYPPLRGDPDFLGMARELVFGSSIVSEHDESIASIQTVSGTGANTLIAKFLHDHAGTRRIWLPSPTWVNHEDIWRSAAPDVDICWYPYYNPATKALDFEGMMQCLSAKAQPRDVILLHACAHNPTGLDPSDEQWRRIARLCIDKNLFVVLDSAYQGFASGDLERDVWVIRQFFKYPEIEFAVCQSFSKNLGLYGERVGALHLVVSRSTGGSATRAEHHLVQLHRASVSMAPVFGSRVALEVLRDAELRKMWHADLATMSGRIKDMRKALYDELIRLRTPGSWEHITQQTGLFSFTGLTETQVARLQSDYHVYMLPTGRASICGLSHANVKYAAQAIHAVVTGTRESS